MDWSPARDELTRLPSLALGEQPSPLEPMDRLRAALGGGPRLLVKRDDAIPFGFGGNKVRKLRLVAAHAVAEGADTLVTTGGLQSNHCRATAAAAAKLGLRCVLVVNGAPQPAPSANALLDRLLGAEVEYVAAREERAPRLRAVCERLRGEGRRPFEIPLGASTPLGAAGLARAVGELLAQQPAPDVIVHSTSSGGTQAGLVAGVALHGLRTRVIGVSADEPAASLAASVREIVAGLGALLGGDGDALAAACSIEVDDRFVGEGYGVPSDASREAQQLAARTEALFVDHTYTAKAFAGLLALLREGRLRDAESVLFWHTGGQVGLFA
jgi:1-aminocyclopropane-1-carboxylate deaminase/D-cysteine desulfhydrase-like pyridoxal-dependent ACC family enzyme